MSAAALSTRGLDKRFGSLVVAQDVALDLPQGERYALIGPNGAGKTTLINLVTGMLRPDRGTILLGGDDVTALDPEERVRRGLVRTFQINALFPHLSALEAVTLAVCERRGYARNWWRTLPRHRDAVEEAHAILASLRLAASCHRPTRAIAALSQDIAVLFIEHDMNVVFRFANRIIVMVAGRILVEGTPREIAADARVREVYLGRTRHG